MGLNFLGLGFSLGAQDKGLAGAIKDTSSGLMDISKSVVGIGLASAKMIFKAPNFGPAASLAQTLAGDIKLTTTGIEAFGVAANKATSAGLAGLNMTDEQFRKSQSSIASTAFSMNTDVGAVTKSFAALQQAGIDVKKVGFKSFEQYQKFIEVTGTDSTAFAASLGTMNKQMGMSPELIEDSVTAVAAIGKKFNIGREAVAGMATTVKILNANSNLLPQNWSPAKMSKFLKGTTVVAGALTSIGLTADEAMAASQGLTKGLLAGNKGMADLYAGVKSELPQAFQVMTENFGDANKAFEMLQADPQQFMLRMGDMVKKVNNMHLKPEAMNRFRSQMEATFGPDIMATFNKQGFGQLEPALKKADVTMKEQGKVIGDLASKYSDGRTYMERFAIAQDIVQTKLKQVHGVMSDSKYLKTYVAQGKEFTDWASKTAAKGGPLGKLTTALIEVTNRGFGGFLASHSKFGFAMAEGIKLMQPMLQYLPALKMAFTALSSPIGLVVGALAGLYFLFKDLAKGKDSVVAPMLKKLQAEAPVFIKKMFDFVKGIFATIFEVLSKVDWDSVIKTVSDFFFTVFNTVFDALASVDWGKVFDIISKVFTKVFDTIFDVLGRVNWGEAAKIVGDAFKLVFNTIFKAIESINWNKVGEVLGILLSKAVEIAIDLVKAAFKLGEKLLNWLDGIDWGAVGKKIGDYFAQLADMAITMFVKILQNLPEIIGKIISKAVDFFVGILDGIRDYLVKKFPEATKPIVFIFEMLKAAVSIVGGALKLAFKAVWWVLSTIWDIVKGVFSVIGDIASGIASVAGKIGSVVSSIGSGIKGAASAVYDFFSGSDSGAEDAGKRMLALQQKLIADTKRITEEAQKKAKEARDADLRAHGVATEGYVKTVEGQIIKSTDALTQYQRDATGAIVAVSVAAAKYTKAVVGGEAFVDMEKMQAEIRTMNDTVKGLKSGTDEWDKAMDDIINHGNQAHEEYFKKFGVRWDIMYAQNEKLKGQYALSNEVLKKATDQGQGYFDALIALQTKMSEQTGALILKQEQLRAAGKENTQEFIDLSSQIMGKMADDQKVFGEAQQVMSGHLAAAFDQYVGKAEKQAVAAERTAYMIAEAYKNSVDSVLKGLPATASKTAETVKSMMVELGDAQNKEVNDLLAHTTLTGTALEKAVNDVKQKYIDQSKAITDVITKNHDALIVGAQGNTLAALDNIKKGYADMTKQVDTKTNEAATEIQKQFGVTADAAVQSVNQIAAIDPNIFKKNMAVVKTTFMGFLKEMDDKGKKLLDNTTKSFNDMWKTMNDGWKANTKLLQDFTDSAAANVEKYWGKVMLVAMTSVGSFIQLTKQIETGLSALARTMNIMDLLASPDQINAWASMVVSALSFAFRTGSVGDAMITSSYNKALAMAAEIQQNSGSATPDASKMQASGSSSAITAAQGLLMSINHPTWATDEHEMIPTKLETLHQDMIAMLKALQGAGETKAAQGAKAGGIKPRHGS